MIAAAGEIEHALQALGAAYAAYQGAYRTVSRAAHPNVNRQLTLETQVGTEPLNNLIVRRLRALGLGAMLEQARTSGTIEDIAGVLQSKIRQHIPR